VNKTTALLIIAVAIAIAGTVGIKVVGFDGMKMGHQAIRDGKMYAEPVQHLAEMDAKTADLIARYTNGEDVPSQFLIPTTLYRKADADKGPQLKYNRTFTSAHLSNIIVEMLFG